MRLPIPNAPVKEPNKIYFSFNKSWFGFNFTGEHGI